MIIQIVGSIFVGSFSIFIEFIRLNSIVGGILITLSLGLLFYLFDFPIRPKVEFTCNFQPNTNSSICMTHAALIRDVLC